MNLILVSHVGLFFKSLSSHHLSRISNSKSRCVFAQLINFSSILTGPKVASPPSGVAFQT